MAKKLSKILWHDTKVDGAGKPVLPSVATDDKGLNGLLPGELFMHVGKEKVSLWALSLSGEVVEVSGKTDEVDIDLSDYLLKSVWDSVFEIKTDVSGQKYIFGKLPVVTKYGITMYADDGNVDIPQLAEGLPFDQRTIWFNPETEQIEVIGGTGGGVATNGEAYKVYEQAMTSNIDVLGAYKGLQLFFNVSNSSIGTVGAYDAVLHVAGSSRGFQLRSVKDSTDFYVRNVTTNGFTDWNKILHAGNYSSYALPLSGGTLNGILNCKGINSSADVNINSNRLLMSSANSYGESSWKIYAYGPTVQFVETSNANWCLKLNNDNSINVNNIITSKGVNGRYSEFDSNGISCYGTTSGGYTVGVSLYDNNGTFKQTIINAFGDGSNFSYIFIGGEYNKPWIKIDTSANMLVKGGITMYSDIRKKTKLQDVELSLSQIANAPLIEHYYNSDQDKTTHVGSIAQYWASLNDWFCKLDAEGFYTMEIQNCALASAISIARELVKYESKTDRTIRKMKQRIQELEDKLEKLEGGNYGNHS